MRDYCNETLHKIFYVSRTSLLRIILSYYLKIADYDTTSDSNSLQIKGKKAVYKENATNLNLVFFYMKLCHFFP